jgi:RNA polymerase sigma factor FliA
LTRPAENEPLLPLKASDVQKRLTEAIRSLHGAERLIVTFYYYEELTTEEITFLLGRTESSVHQVHASAISQLLSRLQL